MTLLFMMFFAIVCACIANSKDRSTIGWFILGFIFGIIALIIVALLPSLKGRWR